MGKYFGTDGFRGEAGVKLTADHAYKIGRYLGWYFGQKHKAKVVIGKDTRKSSYMLELALTAGLLASGADAYLLHVTTTPSVSYITRTDGFDCGVMISASHNPYNDNGIKLMNGNGEKMDDGFQDGIEAYIDSDTALPFATGDAVGVKVDYDEGRERYAEYLTKATNRSFANFTIALDCANGSSFALGPKVFRALGAEPLVLSNEPNGTNINNGCGSTHLEQLKAFVKEHPADAAFAFDGDADRCLAVDEKGNEVNGDKIMYIVAKYLKNKGELAGDTLVTTVMSNFGLYKALDKIGVRYEKTAVGDRYVYENMCKNGYSLGGEQSGHIIWSSYARTGDGILTAILTMCVLSETGKKLSELADEVTMYPQVLKNVIVDDKDATLNDPAVIKSVEHTTESLGSDGRVLLRKSGTEPVLRVMAEADTLEKAEACVDEMIEAMKESGHFEKLR